MGHATFVIETPRGVHIATDFIDGTRPPATPTVATMNKAHSSDFSMRPDPGIRHVLRGWSRATVGIWTKLRRSTSDPVCT